MDFYGFTADSTEWKAVPLLTHSHTFKAVQLMPLSCTPLGSLKLSLAQQALSTALHSCMLSKLASKLTQSGAQ